MRENLVWSITVVVCTYNRAEMLEKCLASLVVQESAIPFEIVVVDNNSVDQTKNIVDAMSLKHSGIRYMFEPRQGLSFARNCGASVATGVYLAYIDDDVTLPSDWMAKAQAIIGCHEPDLFGGPANAFLPTDAPQWFKPEYGRRGDMGETGWITKGYIIGCNFFIKKTLLEAYGGFDTRLGMKGNQIGYHEETALVRRAFSEGRKVYFDKELIVWDHIPKQKMELLHAMLSNYRAGKDGIGMWPQGGRDPATLIVETIESIMQGFHEALYARDETRYPYVEQMVFEELQPRFFHLGLQIAYWLSRQKND